MAKLFFFHETLVKLAYIHRLATTITQKE